MIESLHRAAAREGLVRPRARILGGVCAGLARRFDLDPVLVRVLFVVSTLLPGPQILAYLALWVVMPDERDVPAGGGSGEPGAGEPGAWASATGSATSPPR